MAFWNRKQPYDRTRILEAAEKARSRGRSRKAISEYRKILAVDPADAQVNARLALLLAKVGQLEAAAKAFETGAESFIAKGFVEKALAVYVQAAEVFPTDERLWTRIAELTSERGRRADAVNALLKGAAHLGRKKPHRPRALGLLEHALELEPMHLQATLQLAQVLAREGRKQDGLDRLEALARSMTGPSLKQLRRAQFWLAPGPGSLWRWFRAGRGQPSQKPSSPAQRR